jgi:hypothetical protein
MKPTTIFLLIGLICGCFAFASQCKRNPDVTQPETQLVITVTYSDHTTSEFTIPSNLASKDDLRYDLLRWNSQTNSGKQITNVEINEKP